MLFQPPGPNQQSQHYAESPISPGDFTVVVDSMLQGLGKQLRSCGVDVHILDNTDSHDRAIEVLLETSFWYFLY